MGKSFLYLLLLGKGVELDFITIRSKGSPFDEHWYDMNLLDIQSGKVSRIAERIPWELVILLRDRKTVVLQDEDKDSIDIWDMERSISIVQIPKDWSIIKFHESSDITRLGVVLEDLKCGRRSFLFDVPKGKLMPSKFQPESEVLDFQKGRYLVTDWKQILWLVDPKGKRTVLKRLLDKDDTFGQYEVFAQFSPDGNYLICTTGRPMGEPHINWDGYSCYFDLRKAKPVQLQADGKLEASSDLWIGEGDFKAGAVNRPVYFTLQLKILCGLPCPISKLKHSPLFPKTVNIWI
jgi:hypothetical protein